MFAKTFQFYSQPSINAVFPAPNVSFLSQPSFDGTDFTGENTEVVFLKKTRLSVKMHTSFSLILLRTF